MSDHWEVVGGVKRKPKVGNGFKAQEWPATARSATAVVTNSKPVQKTRKKKHIGPRDEKVAPPPSFYDDEEPGTFRFIRYLCNAILMYPHNVNVSCIYVLCIRSI